MNLFLWWHLDANSNFLFSSNSQSSLMIFNFSVRHKSQLPESYLSGEGYATMFHLISYWILSVLSFQIYLESSVSVDYLLCLSDLVCLLDLVLDSPSDIHTDIHIYVYKTETFIYSKVIFPFLPNLQKPYIYTYIYMYMNEKPVCVCVTQ